MGDTGADEKRTGEARSLGIRDAIEVRERSGGLRKNVLGERHHAPNVIA